MANELTWPNPMRQIASLFDELERRGGATSASAPWAPVSDIIERPDEIVITAELPGVKDEDVHVHVGDGVVTISGERELAEEISEDHYRRIERSYGRFERRYPLPAGINDDLVRAQVAYGVLRIVVPKPAKGGGRRVTVSRSEDG